MSNPSNTNFTCSVCGNEVQADYYGTKPPYSPRLVFLENTFVLKDPFVTTNNTTRAVRLGAICFGCNRPVCCNCSVYYTKTFCGKCVQENLSAFPEQIQKEGLKLGKSKS